LRTTADFLLSQGRLAIPMSEREYRKGLHASLAACQWKSVLFYSERLLEQNRENLDALLSRSIVLYCSQKFSELEQQMLSLPLHLMQNTHLLAIRCKALHTVKEHAKIVCLLGGEPDGNVLMVSILPLSDVIKNDTLREIR
jgi:hypothetical protein